MRPSSAKVRFDLAVLQPFLAGGVEGWAMALTSLRDLFGVNDTQPVPMVTDLKMEWFGPGGWGVRDRALRWRSIVSSPRRTNSLARTCPLSGPSPSGEEGFQHKDEVPGG